jgi:hypothetical protein
MVELITVGYALHSNQTGVNGMTPIVPDQRGWQPLPQCTAPIRWLPPSLERLPVPGKALTVLQREIKLINLAGCGHRQISPTSREK